MAGLKKKLLRVFLGCIQASGVEEVVGDSLKGSGLGLSIGHPGLTRGSLLG